jgi:GntR family transcriptional repressor for pyruvate dehydrogenase complex
MTSLRPNERRLYQQVADQIRALIQNGDFGCGDRLPAERELALQLGVSRPSLREALIALEIEGAVEIRMGSGIYVVSAAKTRSSRSAAIGESPVELMQARAVVEGAVTLLAAPQITPEVLASLRRTVASMRAEIEQGRNPIEHDRQFHMLIAEQSGNHVLSRMVGDLFDERHSPISSQFRNRFETRETWRLAVAEHEAILGALEMRDALLAQAMMHTHLEQSKRRWLEGEPR